MKKIISLSLMVLCASAYSATISEIEGGYSISVQNEETYEISTSTTPSWNKSTNWNFSLDNYKSSDSATININLSGGTTFEGNVTVGSGITITTSGSGTKLININGSSFTIEENATLKCNSTANTGSTIKGNSVVTVNGLYDLNTTNRYSTPTTPELVFGDTRGSFKVIDSSLIIGKTGRISQTLNKKNSGYYYEVNIKNSTLTTQSAVGTADFSHILLFQGNSTWNMQSTNAVISGNRLDTVTSQANSVFYLATDSVSPANLTLNVSQKDLNGNYTHNELGTIYYYDYSQLYIDVSALNGATFTDAQGQQSTNSLSIEYLKPIDVQELISEGLMTQEGSELFEEVENAKIELFVNLGDLEVGEKTLRIGNLKELLKSGLVDVYTYSNADLSDLKLLEYVESTEMLGSYLIDENGWITAVPEPAEWALIFGGLALAFVWYRRK